MKGSSKRIAPRFNGAADDDDMMKTTTGAAALLSTHALAAAKREREVVERRAAHLATLLAAREEEASRWDSSVASAMPNPCLPRERAPPPPLLFGEEEDDEESGPSYAPSRRMRPPPPPPPRHWGVEWLQEQSSPAVRLSPSVRILSTSPQRPRSARVALSSSRGGRRRPPPRPRRPGGDDIVSFSEEEKAVPQQVGPPSYDFAIVTPRASPRYRAELEAKVHAAGFETYAFDCTVLTGPREAVTYLRLHVPDERLFEFAAATGVPMRLDPRDLAEVCAALDPPICFTKTPVSGRGLSQLRGLYPPFLHIYAEARSDRGELFLPFLAHNRHKVMLRLLTASDSLKPDGGTPNAARGAGLNVRTMDAVRPFAVFDEPEERIATLMVMHGSFDDPASARFKLYHDWLRQPIWRLAPWQTPIHRIREYFGDQLGFYFLFVATLTWHCFYLGFVGLVIFGSTYAASASHLDRRQIPTCVFAPFIVVAMACFLQDFKRKQSTSNKEWGAYAWTRSRPRVRPAFEGIAQTDPVYGNVVFDFPAHRRRLRRLVAWVVTSGLLVFIIGVIVAIYVFRDWAQGRAFFVRDGVDHSANVAAVLNVLQVQVLNVAFGHVARWLTTYENWKTDAEYSDNLISKLFLFKFFNTFASIVYIAFVASAFEDADGDQLAVLGYQVALLFVSGSAFSVASQVVVPKLKKWYVERRTSDHYGDDGPDRAATREQFCETVEYDNIETMIEDFMEIAIQFSYLACFGASFAVAPFICFVVNHVQIKQDGYKLLELHSPPVPMEVASIGAWGPIFDLIIRLAILSNVGVVVFTSQVLVAFSIRVRMASFIVGVLGLGAIVALIDHVYPARSKAVEVQLRREAVYTARCVQDVHAENIFDEAPVRDDEDEANLDLITRTHDDYS